MSLPREYSDACFDPLPLARLRRTLGKAMHWRYKLFEEKKHSGIVLEKIQGLPLLVTPGVLNPRLMRSGGFFASQLEPPLIPHDSQVLDMGTGSGVCAVAAALHAAHVMAVDISQAAVRCAQLNVALNALDHKVEVLQGDLFAPFCGHRFDVILFNPPFIRGTPRDEADRAWRSTDVAERFASQLKRHLRPSGYALVLLSTYGDPDVYVREFQRNGYRLELAAKRVYVNEKLAILRLVPG